MNEILQIAIVDDDKLFTQLLSRFINAQETMKVVYNAANGDEFLAHYEEKKIDILILDVRMEDGSGLFFLRDIVRRSKDMKIIVLSAHYNQSYIGQMLKLGVSAFLPKAIESEELIEVIETVYRRGHFFTKDQLVIMRLQLSKKIPEFDDDSTKILTERETEILKLICQQYSRKEIGERLFMSIKTVESHKTNLLLKTGAKNTAGLIIYAIQNKIVHPDELILLD